MSDWTEWFKERKSVFSGELRFSEPLSRHTFYRIGGPAAVMAWPASKQDLALLSEGLKSLGKACFILGMGSNVLASDEGFDGIIIKTGRLNMEISELPSESPCVSVRLGASVPVTTLLRKASEFGWAGFERFSGIPGSVGGIVTMNAGTHLGEASPLLTSVEFYDLACSQMQDHVVSVSDFSYRSNRFLPSLGVVYCSNWKVKYRDPTLVKALIDETLVRRKETQPIDQPSCGSVFKNPRESGKRAWEVIDALGLRGFKNGAAQFSEKHPNFILNLGGAKASDVRELIELAKRRARDEMHITLEEEVRLLI